MASLVTIGKVTSTFGKEGGAVLRTTYELNFEALPGLKVFVAPPLIEISYITVNKALARGKRLIVFFKEVGSIDAAEKLVGRNIQVEQEAYKKILKEAEPQPVGFDVYLDNNLPVGKITDIVFSPAHRIFLIKTEEGEILVPEVDHFVSSIDFQSKRLYLRTEEYLKNWAGTKK